MPSSQDNLKDRLARYRQIKISGLQLGEAPPASIHRYRRNYFCACVTPCGGAVGR